MIYLAMQCARHENLYIYHSSIRTLGNDISKLFFSLHICHIFFPKRDTVFCGLKNTELSRMVQNACCILFHVLCVAHGIEQGAETLLFCGFLPIPLANSMKLNIL